MKIDFLTLFPDMFDGFLTESMMKRAQDQDRVSFQCFNFREHGQGKQQMVDDEPYGGGAGMLLKPEPIFDSLDELLDESEDQARIILVDPVGEVFDQAKAEELSQEEHLIFICGHYEGFDERIRTRVTDELSIGDYILTGGELPAMVMADAIVRLLPGVLGNSVSASEDSFSNQLLEHPHYTRPREYRGLAVPEVLTNGNHKLIEEWRHKESLRRTYERRPALLDDYELDEQEKEWLKSFKNKN